MLTEKEANKRGKDILKKLKGNGWELNVYENLGWHYTLYNGTLSLNGPEAPEDKSYWCLFARDNTYKGVGETYWDDGGHYTDPNEAVIAQLAKAQEFVNTCQNAINAVKENIEAK